MKKLVLAVVMLACCSICWGETRGALRIDHQSDSLRPLGPADCAFTFTSGAGSTFLKYCVTANGNVTVFQAPEGHEHIAVGKIGEGYGICEIHSLDSNLEYYDYAEFGESGNWGAAKLVSQSAKSVKIARTTGDGIWTLTQTFTQVTGSSPALKIAMTLKNNTDSVQAADLIRYANVDADGISTNNLDETLQSAFGWNSGDVGGPFGLVLQNAGNVSGFFGAVAQGIPDGPSPCDIRKHEIPVPVTGTDGSIAIFYELAVAAHGTSTATVTYKGF